MGKTLKISARQATALLITLCLSTGVLAVPSFAMMSSGRGAWFSMVIATFSAIPLILTFSSLATFAPTLCLTERLNLLLGPRLGRALSLGFSLFLLYSTSTVICLGSKWIHIFFLWETPIEVIVMGLALISLYGAWLGPQTLSRLNTLYIPFLILTSLMLSLGAFSKHHWIYLWPFWDKGLPALVAGAVPPLAWISETSLILFMAPDISDYKSKRWKIALFASLISGGFFIYVTILTLVTFGPNLAIYYTFPVLHISRTFGVNIRGIDALVLTIWVVGVFQKIALWMYYPIQEIGYIFRLQNPKALLLPMTILQSILALCAPFNMIQLLSYDGTIWPPFALGTFEGLIPFGLFIAWLRYSKRQKK